MRLTRKPGASLLRDHRLAEAHREVAHRGVGLVRGREAAHDLDELHHRHRVHEVHADHAARAAR